MIVKTNAPADSPETPGSHEVRRRDVAALLVRAEAELTELKNHLPAVTEDESTCEAFQGFARRLSRACEPLELGVLQCSAMDLVALIENRGRNPAPVSKFRFLLFTSLEVIAIEIRRIRSHSAN